MPTHYFSKNAHWLIPGHVLQGQHPSRGSGSMSRRVYDIVNRGQCCTFVCLQAECTPQYKNNNEKLKEEEDAILLGGLQEWSDDSIHTYFTPYRQHVVEQGIFALVGDNQDARRPKFLHYGIRDFHPAHDLREFATLINALASRVLEGDVLYIHCWGGQGRAGLVAACLLGTLYDELDAEEALERVGMYCQLRNQGSSEGTRSMLHSPETEEQRDQVRQFFRLMRQQ